LNVGADGELRKSCRFASVMFSKYTPIIGKSCQLDFGALNFALAG
jgi:hypothetical protein